MLLPAGKPATPPSKATVARAAVAMRFLTNLMVGGGVLIAIKKDCWW
jgi:hypothetical protein